MEALLNWLSSIVTHVIEATGYLGISFLMIIESANIPVPSEVIMTFSGFLAYSGTFNFYLVVLSGAVGNLVGSLISYYLGYFGGRKFLEKYGKFLFLHQRDLETANRWFKKRGDVIVFFSRVTPIVRTFISFPAGVVRMNIWKFSVYTFFGSLIWSWLLAFLGFRAGESWEFLSPYFRKFDWLILALIIGGGVWWARRHFTRPARL